MEVNSQAVRFALKFQVTQTIQEEPVAHHMVVAIEVEEAETVEVIEEEDHTVVEREDAAKAAEAIAEEDHINLTKESA